LVFVTPGTDGVRQGGEANAYRRGTGGQEAGEARGSQRAEGQGASALACGGDRGGSWWLWW